MAVLTWRNVDAPDFSASMRGTGLAADLFSNAFGGLNTSLDKFQQGRAAQADQMVMLEALKYSDPVAYQQALSSGAVTGGVNPSFLSTDAIKGLGDRTSNLILDAARGQALSDAQYSSERTRTGNAAMDAAAPLIAGVQRAAVTGNQALLGQAVDQLLSSGNLRPDQSQEVLNSAMDGLGKTTQNRQGIFNLDTAQRDDAAKQQAAAWMAANQSKALTIGDARSMLGQDDTLTPNARLLVGDALAKRYGEDLYGPIGSGSGSGGISGGAPSAPGTAGTRQGNPFDVVVGFGAFGNSSKPITQMSIGEAIQFGKDTLIPGTRNNASLGLSGGKGSSAMGAYQITQQTLQDYAPKVLGADWQSQPMSAENQDKIAEAIFNDRKNGNLKDTWAALPNTAPGAYKDVPWEQMRQEIARREVGANLEQQLIDSARPQAAITDITQAQFQANSNISDQAVFNLAGDDRTPSAVATAVAEATGLSSREVLSEIQRLSADGKINAAQAGRIIEDNVTGQGTAGRLGNAALAFATHGLFGNTSGRTLDTEANDAAVQRFNSPAAQTTILNNNLRAGTAQQIQQAQADLVTARQNLREATQRVSQGQGTRAQLDRYQQAVVNAQLRLQAAQDNQGGIDGRGTIFTPDGRQLAAQATTALVNGQTQVVDTSDAIPVPAMPAIPNWGRIEGR